jgi:cytochrome bd-type quinol oxidase subunit 2
MPKRAPVETKVIAATGSAAGGVATSTFAVWLLGVLVWGAPYDADHAAHAVLAVPAPVSVLAGLAITAGFTWVGSYLARHTPREG